MHAVSVILPTRALAGRADLLRRALQSVHAQQGVHVVPIIVINGPDAAAALVAELKADGRASIVTLEAADLPAALLAGRRRVDTAFFAALDDDDLLLPGALAARLTALEDGGFDAVVSNGFRRDARGDTLHLPDVARIQRDPVRALPGQNWLLPGSWLCRTASVPPELFEGMPRYLENTYLALRLATHCRVRIMAEPTIVWNTDTPLSVTRSREYTLGQVAALERILELDMPADVRASFRRAISLACHANAELCMREGDIDQASAWHRRSLREPGGWRHLLFTRQLLRLPRD